MNETDDTIVAVASANGSSAQALLRISGPETLAAVSQLCPDGIDFDDGRGFRGHAVQIDIPPLCVQAWVNLYRAPASYTREDVAELHVCGSAAVLHAVGKALTSSKNVRWAGPGEFTLRAFLNGRIDLSQAEAVAALISARGREETHAARRGLRGELRHGLKALADGLTETTALLEAALDFPDEDLSQVSPPVVRSRLQESTDQLRELLAQSGRRSNRDDHLHVVLAGFPNAGKSSLLNTILARDAAIASSVPGTTRDPVRGVREYGGRRIEWIDLAGTHDVDALLSDLSPGLSPDCKGVEDSPEDVIWKIVDRLSRIELKCADIVVWVADPHDNPSESLAQYALLGDRPTLLVIQKADLLTREERRSWQTRAPQPIIVSARTTEGVDELLHRVVSIQNPSAHTGAPPRFLLSAHQEAALQAASDALGRGLDALKQEVGYEFVVSDVRDALRALEHLTGRITADVILDHVFSSFCIGK